MRNDRFKLLVLFVFFLTIALFSPLRAAADEDDPPSRVARLSYIHGAVSFNPAGTDDWVNAVINRPITTGDKLWSDQDSRAELHIGSASIRLASGTGFSFLNLTDDVAQLRLTAGTIRIRVKRLSDDETFEVDTPNLAFSILRPGVYKIHVNDEGDATSIKVHGGEGEVTGGGSAYAIHPHESATFTGTDELNADMEDYRGDEDDFDDWCSNRDHHEDLSVSSRYVSPDVVGYEDLDDAGGWRPVPEYGNVWFPHTTVVGWAPYRYGHWAYVYPWGYTWIDDAPWGFAPFHYGRWVFVSGAWGWVPCPPPAPGVVYVRPVYAPALVAWVGGPHFAVGVSVGGGFAAGVNVGWFPLGPREVYVPSYPVSRTYVNNVNITNTTVNTTVVNNYYNNTVINKNVTVVNQTYVNQHVAGAVTATTPQAFTSAQPVAKNVVRVDAREVASAPVNVTTPAVAPPKQAVLGGGAAATVKPPTVVQNRAVVAKVTPPPPPVPFTRQQQAIQANGGKPLAISQTRQLQPQNATVVRPNVKIAPPLTNVNPNPAGNRATTNVNPGNNRGNVSGQNQVNNNGRPGPGNNAGQPNNTGNTGNAGNQDGFRKFGDRPSSAQSNAGNNNSGQNQNAGKGPQGTTNTGQPGSGSNAGNQNAGNQGGNRRFEDRPPSSRPAGNGNGNPNTTNSNLSPLDTHHQQQIQQLHAQQDQERQRLEQQQMQERQKLAQKNADDARQQQLNQKHEQQLQNLEQKHDSQRQQLQQKQQQERKDQGSKSSKDDHRGGK